jgi:hypothetical protein
LTSSQITQPPSHPENQQTSGLQKEKQELIARERQLWYVVTRDYFLIPDLSAIFFGISVTGTKIEDYSLAFQHSKGTITMLSGKSPNYMGHGKSRFLHFANG